MQDGGHQVGTKVVLCVLDGLLTDVILGMDFLKRYNPSISWVDFFLVCLVWQKMMVCVNQARICKVAAWMVLAMVG